MEKDFKEPKPKKQPTKAVTPQLQKTQSKMKREDTPILKKNVSKKETISHETKKETKEEKVTKEEKPSKAKETPIKSQTKKSKEIQQDAIKPKETKEEKKVKPVHAEVKPAHAEVKETETKKPKETKQKAEKKETTEPVHEIKHIEKKSKEAKPKAEKTTEPVHEKKPKETKSKAEKTTEPVHEIKQNEKKSKETKPKAEKTTEPVHETKHKETKEVKPKPVKETHVEAHVETKKVEHKTKEVEHKTKEAKVEAAPVHETKVEKKTKESKKVEKTQPIHKVETKKAHTEVKETKSQPEVKETKKVENKNGASKSHETKKSAEKMDVSTHSNGKRKIEEVEDSEVVSSQKTKLEEKKDMNEKTKDIPASQKIFITSNELAKLFTVEEITASFTKFGSIEHAWSVNQNSFLIVFSKESSAKNAIKATPMTLSTNGKDIDVKILQYAEIVEEMDTIIVGRINFRITEDLLKEYLHEFGEITKVNIFVVGGAKSASVTFKEKLGREVLEFNGALIDGKPCSIRFLCSKDKRVILPVLHEKVSISTLKEYLSEAGEIDDIHQRNKAVFVQFKNYESVQKVLEFDGADIMGIPVIIKRVREDYE